MGRDKEGRPNNRNHSTSATACKVKYWSNQLSGEWISGVL